MIESKGTGGRRTPPTDPRPGADVLNEVFDDSDSADQLTNNNRMGRARVTPAISDSHSRLQSSDSLASVNGGRAGRRVPESTAERHVTKSDEVPSARTRHSGRGSESEPLPGAPNEQSPRERLTEARELLEEGLIGKTDYDFAIMHIISEFGSSPRPSIELLREAKVLADNGLFTAHDYACAKAKILKLSTP